MKKALFSTALLLVLCACLLLCGCSSDASSGQETTDPSAESTAAPDTTDTPASTEFILDENAPVIYDVVQKKFMRATYDWQRGKYATDTGETANWDVDSLKSISANYINVFPPGVNSTMAAYIHGGSLVPQYGEYIMQYNAAGLEYSHKLGVEVTSSLPMILINRGVYEAAGLKVEDYAAVYPNGSIFEGGCLNNPKFCELIYDYTMLSAQSGWDGMFLDGSPYSYGPGYCCCCQYCEQAWAEFVQEKLGREVALPRKAPTFGDEVSRCFFEFRAETFISFVLKLRDDAQKINPNFQMWPNVGMNGALVMYYLNAGLDTVITEFGSASLLQCGEESTLYMYRQFEAIYENMPLLSQHNSIAEQAPETYMYYTAYAEALAGGGNLLVPVGGQVIHKYKSTIQAFNKLVDENMDAFTNSVSIADTAIFYSLNNINSYTFNSTGLIPLNANTPRIAAALLAANGIPFDYINAEKESLTADDLKKYKTIVMPEIQLVDLKMKDMLEEFVKEGGELLILGSKFATNYIGENGYDYPAYEYDVFESWTGTKYSSAKENTLYACGKGQIVKCKRYASNTGDEEKLTPVSTLLKCFETLGLYDQIRVTEDIAGKVETVIRSDATGQRWWVHLITYGTGGVLKKEPYTVTISIPEGETVYDVVPASALRRVANMDFSWEFKDGKLTVSGIFDIHTMLTIYKR